MKAVPLFLAALSLFLAGCESMQSAAGSVKERWAARDTGKVRILPAEPKVVFEAARASIESMGFRITRSGAAQGRIDAVNGLQSDDSLRSSRQIVMKVRITRLGSGTELRAFLTEVIEDNSSTRTGMATETPLIDTPLYEVFFRQVTQTVGKK
ncbi:MAG: hypothetical protein WC378_20105 [Opitutaceae bacterium]|jgi:uncharacterized protein with GYD domain